MVQMVLDIRATDNGLVEWLSNLEYSFNQWISIHTYAIE
jgi:hypothetical protein